MSILSFLVIVFCGVWMWRSPVLSLAKVKGDRKKIKRVSSVLVRLTQTAIGSRDFLESNLCLVVDQKSA